MDELNQAVISEFRANQGTEHFGDAPVLCIFCFHPDGLAVTDAEPPRVSVVGGGSIYPAVQNLLLACRAEGLGCVLTTLLCEAESEVREVLAIPQPWGLQPPSRSAIRNCAVMGDLASPG